MMNVGAPARIPPWGKAAGGALPNSKRHDVRFAKFVVILNGLVPGVLLAWDAYHHQVGANGVNYALHTTGLLSFIFLLLSLTVTPLRKLTGWNSLISFRRALGLYGFFYACSHFLIFFVFDRALGVRSTVHEILFRRYLQIGTAGLLLMVPLALTSTNAMVMRLGAKRWKRLHRLSYLVAVAAAVHYYLLVKSDVRQPLAFAGVLAVLLGYRVVRYLVDRGEARRRASTMRAPAADALSPGNSVIAAAAARPVAPAPKPRYWSGELRVARVFDETADVRTFRLVPGDGGPLPFAHQPGQYLNLALTIAGKRVNRSYTIASSPTRGHYCEVTVKRSASGHGSWHLHDSVLAGSTLKVSAPAGRFFFTGVAPAAGDRSRPRQVVLIAGGVGITPLMSMVRYLTDVCWPGEIYLIFSVRKRADIIFHEELSYLERRFPNLHVCITLTKEEATDWPGARGPITGELLKRFVPGLVGEGAPVYLCGPDAMMAAMQELLSRLGVPGDAVHTEAFVSPPASSAVAPSVTDADLLAASAEQPALDAGQPADGTAVGSSGLVRFRRSGQLVPSLGRQTILDTAEAAGLDLPFECRSGICGQCKVRLVAGRVTMEFDDALTASEKAAGLILACQAHPTGDVTVDA